MRESREDTWTGAVTLGELVARLVSEKKTRTPEFKLLISWFGKEKLRKVYREERARQKREGQNGK